MSKVRTFSARAVVASPAPRDGVPPAPDVAPLVPLPGAPAVRGGPDNASSNVRSSPRFRVPLGTRDSSSFPRLGDSAPAPPSNQKKSSRARFSSPPPHSESAERSAALTAPALIPPVVSASAPVAPTGHLGADAPSHALASYRDAVVGPLFRLPGPSALPSIPLAPTAQAGVPSAPGNYRNALIGRSGGVVRPSSPAGDTPAAEPSFPLSSASSVRPSAPLVASEPALPPNAVPHRRSAPPSARDAMPVVTPSVNSSSALPLSAVAPPTSAAATPLASAAAPAPAMAAATPVPSRGSSSGSLLGATPPVPPFGLAPSSAPNVAARGPSGPIERPSTPTPVGVSALALAMAASEPSALRASTPSRAVVRPIPTTPAQPLSAADVPVNLAAAAAPDGSPIAPRVLHAGTADTPACLLADQFLRSYQDDPAAIAGASSAPTELLSPVMPNLSLNNSSLVPPSTGAPTFVAELLARQGWVFSPRVGQAPAPAQHLSAQQLQELANTNLSSTPIRWAPSGVVLPTPALARQNVFVAQANALSAPFTPPLSYGQSGRVSAPTPAPEIHSAMARANQPSPVIPSPAAQHNLVPAQLANRTLDEFSGGRVTDPARPELPQLSANKNVNFGSTLSSASSSQNYPQSDPPPPRPAQHQPTLADAARFRLAFRSRQPELPTPQQHQGYGSGSGRASVPLDAMSGARVPAREQDAGRLSIHSNVSRGVSQHHWEHIDPGLSEIVDRALDFEVVAQQYFLELSSHLNEEASFAAVRDSAIIDLSSITGLSHEQVDSHLSSQNGDVAAAYVSSSCAAAQLADQEFPANSLRAGMSELKRRRRRQDNLESTRASAMLMPDHGPSGVYSSLANRVNLPVELGYNYRVDSSGIHLPPFPDRVIHSRIRHRARDDLDDLVVSDHDSEPAPSPAPQESSRRVRQGVVAERGRGGGGGGGGGHRDSDDDSDSSRSGSSSASGSNGRDDDSDGEDSDGSSGDSSAGGDARRDPIARRDDPPRVDRSNDSRQHPQSDARYGELSPDRLERLLERLLSRQSGGNNGLMAPKPNFWTLGSPPNGGYHLETFSRLYREFKEFKRIYGKHTGVSFKNLITLDVSPLVREDLKLRRSEWKKLDDRQLIRMLKTRLGYQDSDHYIALLESCPKLPDKMKDTVALSNHFKDLSGKMLEIIERAHRHKVKLRKASLKHVFSTAIKSSYRMTNWFHLEKFKSIGDSVRFLNTKIKDRLSHELERKHEQEQDARFAGVRGQIGSGTQEASEAPDRRGPKKQVKPVKSGISKGPKVTDSKDKSPFGKLSPEEYRKKMDELYQIENKLARGRHFHERTVYCDGDPCPFKRCQGCGEHTVKGRSGHDRPHCPHRKHKDFVHEGYFHEKWPGRTSIFANDIRPSAAPQSAQPQRSPHAGRFNGVREGDAKDEAGQ